MTALTNEIIVGDAHSELARLPDRSVDMVLTSPPYFRLRNYGVPDQIGSESSVDGWVRHLCEVTRELHRVLVLTGTLWLNLGDTYATHLAQGAARKSLLLAPERLAMALTRDGWVLRNKIVWRKANPMPTSVRDRLACTWEAIYIFAKQPDYYFDLDAIRVPHTSQAGRRHRMTSAVRGREAWRGPNAGGSRGLDAIKAEGRVGHPLGKNPGDVWTLASSNYRGSHRATFPARLVERAILAGCPEQRCIQCHAPWRRAVLRALGGHAVRGALAPTCSCGVSSETGTVLDPFIGSGTTAVAAEMLGRNWLGIELNPAFVREAEQRLSNTGPPATGRVA